MSYFNDDTINKVWEKADPIPGMDSNVWRTHGEPLMASKGCFGIQVTKPLIAGLASTTQPPRVWDPLYRDALKKAYFEHIKEQDALKEKDRIHSFSKHSNSQNIWAKYGTMKFLIRRDCYGNQDSEYGWQIDHIYPESKGGSDDIGNLQPLHWRANKAKGDKVL